jgi:hypothetical protein
MANELAGQNVMAVKRPTLLVIAVAAVVAGLAALVVWDAYRPVVGDWRPQQRFEHPRVSIQLKRLAVGPWSRAIPEAIDRADTMDRPKDLDAFYVYVELGFDFDGLPMRKAAESATRSFRFTDVSYNGEELTNRGTAATFRGTDPDSEVFAFGRIVPWKRGFGQREFVVQQEVTLETGEKVRAVFRFPAR